MRVSGSCLVGSLLLATQGVQSAAAQQNGSSLQVVDRLGSAILVRSSGGSVAIVQGFSVVSRLSTLELDWEMVIDSSLGIVFDGPVGASGVFDDPWFRYASNMKMKALVPISAFEVRILTFSIWGDFTGTLSFTQLEELAAGQRKSFDRVWGIYGESQLRAHLRSIAYVAKVLRRDGTSIVADPALVLKAAQAIQASVTLQDLSPKPEPIPLAGIKK